MFLSLARKTGFYGGIGFLTLFAILPVLWAFLTIFKTSGDLYSIGISPFFFDEPPTLSNLVFLFTRTNFPTFLWNSAIVGVCVVAITLLLAVPAAFALARLTGRWGEHSGMAIFLVYLIPPSLLFIPMYQIVVWLGVANSIWSLVIVLPTITIPFCTWLLLGFFRSVPRTLDEAALLDGCGQFTAFRKVVLPQVYPGIGACAVFAFSLSLGNYIYAATFINASAARNISAGVPTELIRGDVFYWPELMAATLVVAIPLAIAYGLFFNYLVGGFKNAT
ncbi:carbohydrate ABC transporter membrane protein 2, CUT1 family [Modicisalibacter muralis]|uniref:Carbohydrate ABC transporter membrane protein 2, CUT1 family n=1 Tax=Modicisalibacter muralis TaxID=119000 RepID=A0A1G9KDK2_9GAMM|nr:carbohydrate ABC transporter permease [Halomonas muralis]SDL47699.1 carbohydrate ABC transporter membrane protein 2, CUT1 family [Halomonas muralis]